jgi:Tfp pilus assembly protein PilE
MNKKGVTLAELLIVFTVIMIIIGIIIGTNYFTQTGKAHDLKRKSDLSVLREVAEDYYADHNMYPSVEEMAYKDSTGQVVYTNDMTVKKWAGKVCGSLHTSEEIRGYSKELPCNPSSPTEDYVYFTTPDKQSYAIFTNLTNKEDPAIEDSNCIAGCSYITSLSNPMNSLSREYIFNYMVSSSDYNYFCSEESYFVYYANMSTSDCSQKCLACPGLECSGGWTRAFCSWGWCYDNCQNEQ